MEYCGIAEQDIFLPNAKRKFQRSKENAAFEMMNCSYSPLVSINSNNHLTIDRNYKFNKIKLT
jgi:hypothetical protein